MGCVRHVPEEAKLPRSTPSKGNGVDMSNPYPSYDEEQAIMYREEDHDCPTQECSTCHAPITEDNYGGEVPEGECDECFAQRVEFDSLENTAGRLADELSEALADYRRSKTKKETLRQRITFGTLEEALSLLRGAIK